MRKTSIAFLLTALAFSAGLPSAASAGENELTAKEKAEGWRLLFNGKDLTGWKCNNGKPVATPVEEGAIVPYKAGGYVVVNERQYGDFILSCDVKQSTANCNSGVFFRIGNLKDPVQTGFEVQVYKPGTGMHDFGAIYDLVPAKKADIHPAGEWNHMEITCRGPKITVRVNGELVSQIDCDEWTQPGKRLDGSKNKFKMAVKDFPRVGYLGFQDHGQKCWYRNVKILELKD